jgi:hypothetical protein
MVYYGGIGYHVVWLAENHPLALVTFAKLQVSFTILYSASVTFPKLAILGLYQRIFTEKPYRIIAYILMGIVTTAFIVLIICTVAQCIPLGYLWNKKGHPGGHCFNTSAFWRYGSVPNIVTDVVMLFLPLPCIWKLQLSRRDKIGLVITFFTGSMKVQTMPILLFIC